MTKAKGKAAFTCNACGATAPKWQGQCQGCGAWNSIEESIEIPAAPALNRFEALAGTSDVVTLAHVDGREVERVSSGLDEFDRVLGGGVVPGAAMLISGEPGVGKSTLLLQVSEAMSNDAPVLYVSGEESAAQIGMRAKRLGLKGNRIRLMGEICLERILAAIDREKPALVIIDSIQTIYSMQLTSAPGSVAQVRDCGASLIRVAKQNNTPMVMVGHVTKENTIAGPMLLAHGADVVLSLEGDAFSQFRVLRASKNRFGPATELGIFGMGEAGMRPVANPSAMFMHRHGREVAGTCVVATVEGTRPLLVEIQALTDAGGPSPRRLSVGLERDRLAMLLAVMNRHGGLAATDKDVFVNAVGGVRIQEPAVDLAVMLAIASSLRGKPLPRGMVAWGEIGLAGEVRPASRGMERLREAEKLGMSSVILPKANAPKKRIEGLTVYAIERVEDALKAAGNAS